ncbi:hypothetical protein [Cellulomonas carbonis]|uniref:Uncharacterized protein n=1 Tax=Cellulomonas carbonis T26 TaxID=947969 RepID=A0A0A0BWD0_9CELL|nr:hypothetical protein [Cellulomonas carbonis]KGM12693.1 hypothetical protein N868_07065 [Cellulomonas carbonis T26]
MIIIAGVVVFASTVALIIGTTVATDTAALLLQNFGAVLLSIGLISIAYDLFVRESYTAELFDLTNTAQSLRNLGLLDATVETAVDWERIFRGTHSIKVVVAAGDRMVSLWPEILAATSGRPITIDCVVNDPKGPHATEVADMRGASIDESQAQLSSQRRAIEKLWDAYARDASTCKGSRIRLAYAEQTIAYEYIHTDSAVVILLDRALTRKLGEKRIALVMDPAHTRPPAEWWYSQFNERPGATVFEGEVK